MTARMLRLLSLLQTRREWSGADLAERLGVTVRTVRRDIDRLRELGYPVDSARGHAGGYRLTPGTDLPPLLLDDDEAVAIAAALRTAAGGLTGIEETALLALAKLEQVLPRRLRGQVTALQTSLGGITWEDRGPRADPALLATLAAACRDHEIVAFDYTTRHGTTTSRRAEPCHRAVATVHASDDHLPRIAQTLAGLDTDYTLDADPAVRTHLRAAAHRALHATA